jgi:phosphate/sulfate permease
MEDGLWLPMLGGLCFVLGIVTVGSRTIATVGSKITKLTQATAFSVQSVRPQKNTVALFIHVLAAHPR